MTSVSIDGVIGRPRRRQIRQLAKSSDHAELHKRSVEREILKVLNRAFGSLVLHEITAHQIEQHSAQARCL